jgi:hypothetical protein
VGVERKMGGRVLLQGDVRAVAAVSNWAWGGWPFHIPRDRVVGLRDPAAYRQTELTPMRDDSDDLMLCILSEGGIGLAVVALDVVTCVRDILFGTFRLEDSCMIQVEYFSAYLTNGKLGGVLGYSAH